MKKLIKPLIITCSLFSFFISSGQVTSKYDTRLVYSCTFDSQEALKDWIMEGPGVAEIKDGKLLLHSKYFDAANDWFRTNGTAFSGMGEAYYQPVEAAMRKDLGDAVMDYYYEGIFRGGHLVYWNKFKTPDNYILECDFQSLSDNALHMLMFSCTGNKGQNVFDTELKKRWGIAAQYTKSDLHNYRISFFAPGRGTCNMRKCPGRRLTIKGEDLTLKDKSATHQLRIIKYEKTIEWYINGQLSFRFADDMEDGHLKGGQTAIRLMVPAMGLYDNYRIYEITQ
jgi:hypothetical protein